MTPGGVDESGDIRHVAVRRDDQEAAVDHEIGGAGEVLARERDVLAGFGLNLDPLSRDRILDPDVGPAQLGDVERHARGAGVGNLRQLLIIEPFEHRPLQLARGRIDEGRDRRVGVAAVAVVDFVAKALQARLHGREGHRAVRVEGDLTARRLACSQQPKRVAVRIVIVLQHRNRDRAALGGLHADIARRRWPVGGRVGRWCRARARGGLGLRKMLPCVEQLRVSHRDLHSRPRSTSHTAFSSPRLP